MGDPKKHHFLPQYYLQGFSANSKHLYLIEKARDPQAIRVAIDDAACKHDYHTIDTDPENKDRRSIESHLSKIEGVQAELIRSITKQEEITTSQKQGVSEFIALMRTRVPAVKAWIEQFLRESVRGMTRIESRAGRLPPPPPEVLKLLCPKGENIEDVIEIVISNWMILLQMLNIALHPDHVSIFLRMEFALLRAPRGREFVTSDWPVAVFHPTYDKRSAYGASLYDREIEVSIPITSRHLILCSWDKREFPAILTRNQVDEFNRRTIVMGDKYVYARSASQRVLNLVGRVHAQRAGFDVLTLDYGKGFAHVSRFVPVTK